MRTREESLNYHQKQLDESNRTMNRLNNQIRDLEIQNEKLSEELNNLDNINQKEVRLRIEKEKSFEDLEKHNKEKDRNIKQCLVDLDSLQEEKDKLLEDNTKMFNELDRLKNHIFVITEQNQRVLFFI